MFEVIAGSGHCGTMWLSQVLDGIPGRNWFHEKKTDIVSMPWYVADLNAPDSPLFEHYWTYAQSWLDAGHFGDSNSWPPEMLPAVHDVMPIDRVIYLTRDKADQLHSLTTKSPVWSKALYTVAATRRLDLYAEISGMEKDVSLLVEANDFMPGWLRDNGLYVEVYSLEELTTDIRPLRELAPLAEADLLAWQNKKINQKVLA